MRQQRKSTGRKREERGERREEREREERIESLPAPSKKYL